jgi:integrase
VAGHITKRGESAWRLHAYIGRDENGRRRYATKTVHGTKREADRALAAFVTDVGRDRSATAASEPMTVSQVLNSWLEAKSPVLSPVTVDRYRVAFKHIEPAIGAMKVARLRPSHIEDLTPRCSPRASRAPRSARPIGRSASPSPGRTGAASRR